MTEHRGRCWPRQVAVLLMVALVALGAALARGESRGSSNAAERETLVKELGLTPEQARDFQAVGDKYDQGREAIVGSAAAKENDLEKALAAPQPDEARIKELVAAVIQGHDQLFQSIREQRQAEMALLTPVQQGKFIMALKRWHQGR